MFTVTFKGTKMMAVNAVLESLFNRLILSTYSDPCNIDIALFHVRTNKCILKVRNKSFIALL